MLESFEVFCSAFTHNKKELEHEEHAILELFQSLLGDSQCLEVTSHGTNRFKKIMTTQETRKEIETFHLGLYRTFGGRFTLVHDGKDYYLVFCVVPKPWSFQKTALLEAYTAMLSRTAVLSRDWCLARSKLSEHDFTTLKAFFEQNEKSN